MPAADPAGRAADETDVTPAAGGTPTSTFTDALGQTTATWSYDDSATPTDKAADAKVTSYAYTPAGQLASVTDNAGNQWTYSYNLLGEKIAQTDPDSGQGSIGYDADGNITSTTDARGQTLVYAYDALNRKIAEYAGSVSAANELDSWTYDTLAKGQLTSATSYVGGASGPAYTEAVTGYSDEYQATGTSMTIPSAEGALAGTYTTSSTYSPNTGELDSTAYSADGGLRAETVNYSYDTEGLLSAFGGNSAYLDATSYSPLGQVLRTTTGPSASELAVTSAYDAGTGRLLQATDNVQAGTAALDTTSYTYNPAGDITSESDAQGGGATDTQCFTYNDLQQLTTAWTDTAGTTTAAGPSVSGTGGCATATPSAATIGGPAAYWESWAYDALGDRTSETIHDTSGDTADNVTQTLTYPGGNGTTAASQPSAASTVATTGPGGSTTTSYTYDNAGDTTARTSTSTGSTPPAGPSQSFTYTPEGQVKSATTGTGSNAPTSSYLYDANGNLLIQRDPGTTTLYLDGGAEELQLTTATGAVSGLRYYAEPDGTTITLSSSGAITYELANQQGTNTETISATTLAVTRRYYDPYGNPRGALPSSWVDNRGFLDQPSDTRLGSRCSAPVSTTPSPAGSWPSIRCSNPVTPARWAATPTVPTIPSPTPTPAARWSCAAASRAVTPTGAPSAPTAAAGTGTRAPAGVPAVSGCAAVVAAVAAVAAAVVAAVEAEAEAVEAAAAGVPVASGCAPRSRRASPGIRRRRRRSRPPPDMAECVAFFGLLNCVPANVRSIMSGNNFGSWLGRQVGNFTGITDAINCIKNPRLGVCAKAAIKLTMTVATVMSLGAAAPADEVIEAGTDPVIDMADAAATPGDAAADQPSTEAATSAGSKAAAKSEGSSLGRKCVAAIIACTVPFSAGGPDAAGATTAIHSLSGYFAWAGANADIDVGEEFELEEPYAGGFGPGDPWLPPGLGAWVWTLP